MLLLRLFLALKTSYPIPLRYLDIKKKILKKSDFDGSQLFSLQTLKFEADFTEVEKLHFLADPTIIQAFPQHVLMYTGTCYYFGL